MSFIYDSETLPTKTNYRALSVASSQGFQASDWALLKATHEDARTAILTGQYHGFSPRSGAQITALSQASTYRIYFRDSDKHFAVWDGTAVRDLIAPASLLITAQATKPTELGASARGIWWDSDDNKAYVWDGTSSTEL